MSTAFGSQPVPSGALWQKIEQQNFKNETRRMIREELRAEFENKTTSIVEQKRLKIEEVAYRRGMEEGYARAFHEGANSQSIPKARKTMADIVTEVARKHGLSVEQLRANRRDSMTIHAKHEAFYRCRRETGHSMPVIGRFFGNDHTTVLHGVRRHEERLAASGGPDAA